MYQYDNIDQTIVNERVAQFRDQTSRYLSGKLTDDEFRPLRLQNGLYIQRHAPMLRIAVPYGLLSSNNYVNWQTYQIGLIEVTVILVPDKIFSSIGPN